MKKLFLLGFIIWGCAAMAQETEGVSDTSKDRSSEDFYVEEEAESGSFFIEHKVTQGEQMAMISRQYLIEPKEIYLYNTDAVNGIKSGTVLKIPLHKSKKKNLDGFIKELEKSNGGSVQVAAPQKKMKMGVM
ncbi:LysM peptidoglycan-binding domain-containing protein [Flavobacterium sp.]|uniref:LysM peptidoglycan-binding domain-containing protein n=1 Tax=Flavobacterium sp. TaxID=239 RepID=UPI0040337FDB